MFIPKFILCIDIEVDDIIDSTAVELYTLFAVDCTP